LGNFKAVMYRLQDFFGTDCVPITEITSKMLKNFLLITFFAGILLKIFASFFQARSIAILSSTLSFKISLAISVALSLKYLGWFL